MSGLCLAPCLLSAALSPVSSTLNGSSRCYSVPVVGWFGWLINTFPNERNSSPHSLYTSFCPFLLLFTGLSPPAAYLSHLSLPPLPRAHWSSSFCILSSQQCTFFTRPMSHFPLLLTAIHQLFAISFPFPLFIVSSFKSIYNSGSLNNCCTTKICYSGNLNSNAVLVSAICPVLQHSCLVKGTSIWTYPWTIRWFL